MLDGSHDESPQNGTYGELVGLAIHFILSLPAMVATNEMDVVRCLTLERTLTLGS